VVCVRVFERCGAVFTVQVDASCAGELPHGCAATALGQGARNLVRESLVGFSAKSVSSAAPTGERCAPVVWYESVMGQVSVTPKGLLGKCGDV